jgi:crossover junction endodeoxyribonuclease RuvC
MDTPRVVGIDASLTGSGIASTAGWCTTIGAPGVTTLPVAERADAIKTLAAKILLELGTPDLVLIEGPSYSSKGGGGHERSGLWWWIVERVASWETTAIAEVPPSLVKKYATGKGQAKKEQMVDAVARRFPWFETKGDNNQVDAVVLAAMGADYLGTPLAPMPATHRSALDKVAWPEAAVA